MLLLPPNQSNASGGGEVGWQGGRCVRFIDLESSAKPDQLPQSLSNGAKGIGSAGTGLRSETGLIGLQSVTVSFNLLPSLCVSVGYSLRFVFIYTS